MSHPFCLVDVFTDRPLAGNQLAVVLDAGGLDSVRMQAIAREFNFSETTFVSPSSVEGCDWRVRIFTPGTELPMAGHPTIGTAVVLEAMGLVTERTMFELGVGPTPVSVRSGWAEMEQAPPHRIDHRPEPAALAAALSVEPALIAAAEQPFQAISTGLPYFLVPLPDLAAIRRVRPRTDALSEVLKAVPGAALYCYTVEVEQGGSDAHCRMFHPEIGEDPATGSAAGPLACGLAFSRGGEGKLRFRFEQGFEMGRPSLIEAAVDVSGGAVKTVKVGGQARIVGEGWLTL
jgi:trans-2,3-dihydro-3-hydroxyanthranilate isomerase